MDSNMKYIIFDVIELDKVNIDETLISSLDTLRYSNDGSKTIIKWIGDEPSFISELISKSITYNNDEMIEILTQPEWVGELPQI